MQLPFVDAAQVHATLPFATLVDDLERAHREAQPQIDRLLLEQGEQAMLVLPAWQGGVALGAKLVTSFPANPARGLASVQGVYILFDGMDGRPLALIDGAALTLRKTAADSALASRYLSRTDAATLLMVGAGDLAPYLIEAHRAVRPSIRRVLVWNRTQEKAQALAERSGGEAVYNLDAVVPEADIIACATSSRVPLIKGALLRSGAHLDLVGSYTPLMRETDGECFRRASVHVDARWSTLGISGDLTQAIDEKAFSQTALEGDLFDLARGHIPGRKNEHQITLCKNGGGAHLDLMTAQSLMRHLHTGDLPPSSGTGLVSGPAAT